MERIRGLTSTFDIYFCNKAYNAISNCIKCKKKNPRLLIEGKAIKISKWRAWKKKNDPQVSKGKTTFKNLDKNNNGKISSGEFFKFHKRWIQN